MKTLIFSILLSACTVALPSKASDFYDDLAWGPVAPAIQALPSLAPAPLTVDTFRRFFRHSPVPEIHELVKACGHPADEWNGDIVHHPGQKIPAHLPAYHGGHFFRYLLPDGSHVYVWTGEDDGPVMRADYVSTSGHVAPLYLRIL